MTEGLRRKLAESAKKKLRSLNSEIIWRLGQSFGTEGEMWAQQEEANEQQRQRDLDEIVERLAGNSDFLEKLRNRKL